MKDAEYQEETNKNFSEDDLYDTINELASDNERALNKEQIRCV